MARERTAATIKTVITADNQQLIKKLNESDNAGKMFSGKLASTLKTGALAAGAALAGIGVAATKMAIEFETSMAQIGTLIPGQVARLNELSKSVLEMSTDVGTAAGDISSGMYQVISAFGDTTDTVRQTEIAVKAAKAGMSDTTSAVNLLSAVTKGYGDSSAEALEQTSDLAFLTVKLGQTTFPELASSMGKVIPIASKLGVSQQELFAEMATLTGVTGTAAEVSTQLRGALAAMMKPTGEMSAAIEKLGFANSEAMIKSLGMVGSLQKLIGTTDGTNEAVGKLFSNVESLPAIFALSGANAEQFSEKLAAMNKAGGETDQAFNVMAGTMQGRLDRSMATINESMIKLGEALFPLAELFAALVEQLADGIKFIKPFADEIAELAAVISGQMSPALREALNIQSEYNKMLETASDIGLSNMQEESLNKLQSATKEAIKNIESIEKRLLALPNTADISGLQKQLEKLFPTYKWEADVKAGRDAVLKQLQRIQDDARETNSNIVNALKMKQVGANAQIVMQTVTGAFVGGFGKINTAASETTDNIKNEFQGVYDAVLPVVDIIGKRLPVAFVLAGNAVEDLDAKVDGIVDSPLFDEGQTAIPFAQGMKQAFDETAAEFDNFTEKMSEPVFDDGNENTPPGQFARAWGTALNTVGGMVVDLFGEQNTNASAFGKSMIKFSEFFKDQTKSMAEIWAENWASMVAVASQGLSAIAGGMNSAMGRAFAGIGSGVSVGAALGGLIPGGSLIGGAIGGIAGGLAGFFSGGDSDEEKARKRAEREAERQKHLTMLWENFSNEIERTIDLSLGWTDVLQTQFDSLGGQGVKDFGAAIATVNDEISDLNVQIADMEKLIEQFPEVMEQIARSIDDARRSLRDEKIERRGLRNELKKTDDLKFWDRTKTDPVTGSGTMLTGAAAAEEIFAAISRAQEKTSKLGGIISLKEQREILANIKTPEGKILAEQLILQENAVALAEEQLKSMRDTRAATIRAKDAAVNNLPVIRERMKKLQDIVDVLKAGFQGITNAQREFNDLARDLLGANNPDALPSVNATNTSIPGRASMRSLPTAMATQSAGGSQQPVFSPQINVQIGNQSIRDFIMTTVNNALQGRTSMFNSTAYRSNR